MKKIMLVLVTTLCLFQTTCSYAEGSAAKVDYTYKHVFLFLAFHDDNSNGERHKTRMPDWDTCFKVLETMRIAPTGNVSGDFEVSTVAFCGEGTSIRGTNQVHERWVETSRYPDDEEYTRRFVPNR